MQVEDTKRLHLALMNRDDAQLLFELDQNPEVMRYINGGNMTTMEEINDIYIPRMESYTNAEQGWGLWKVVVKETGEFIGWILVRPMDFFSENPQLKNLELGWRFKQNSWGQGYATEAAQQITQALFKQNNIEAVSAIAMEENHGSIGIMKKLGMQFVKAYLHKDPLGDSDVVLYQRQR